MMWATGNPQSPTRLHLEGQGTLPQAKCEVPGTPSQAKCEIPGIPPQAKREVPGTATTSKT